MITIISGTNRPGSLTSVFARHILATSLAKTDQAIELIDLAEITHEYFSPGMYSKSGAPKDFLEIYETKLRPARKLIVLSPEYNGSFAGALKVFIDAVSVHNYKDNFTRKPILLVGVSTGRAGNLRGLDHLSTIFEHMGGYMIGGKLPISRAGDLVNEAGEVVDEATKATLEKQIDHLISI